MPKHFILFFLLLLFFVPCKLFSQAKVNVDSLLTVLQQYPKEDTLKVQLLLKLVKGYRMNNPPKAMEYAEAALKISEQLQHDFWLSQSYMYLSGVYYLAGDLVAAKANCQKAISFLEKNNQYPDELADCTMMLGSIALSNGEVTAALAHYESAFAIFERTQNVKKQISTLVGIANCHNRLGNYQKALELYQTGLKKNASLNNKDNLLLLYSNIAMVYGSLGNYALGLEYRLKVIDICNDTGNLYSLAKEYNNISSVYYALNDKVAAHNYLEKALALHRKLNDQFGIAHATINMSLTHEDEQKAIAGLKESLVYAKETNNKYLLGLALQYLCSKHIDIAAYPDAYAYLQQAFEIEKDGKNKENIIKLQLNGSETLLRCSDEDLRNMGIAPNNRYGIAQAYLDEVFSAADNASVRQMAQAWRNLSIIQEKQQNYSLAYESFKKYIALKDSTSSDDIRKQITRKEIQYEFDKKETALKYEQQLTAEQLEKQRLLTQQQEQTLVLNQQTLTLKEQALTLSNKEKDLVHLAYLKEQAEKQEKAQELSLSQEREKGKARDLSLKNLELSAQQQQNLYLFAFSALLLAGLGTLSYFYTALKKQKNIIAQQNAINEQTISILSHDIKSPLMGVKLLLKKLNKDDPFVAQASQSLEDQINAVNGVLNNLLRMKKMALSQPEKTTLANANTVLQQVLRELNMAIQAKNLSIQNELKGDVTLPISPEKLQIVFHNLLSNAIKYSYPNQPIRIFQDGSGVTIQDYGVGLSPEQRSKTMREVTASRAGTQQERGNGLGLFLVGALLQDEKIRVFFDSPDRGGTIVKVVNG
jgi:signal transduction histidine kinase